jgi:hypothetical protein
VVKGVVPFFNARHRAVAEAGKIRGNQVKLADSICIRFRNM